jgi:hypothetical protein
LNEEEVQFLVRLHASENDSDEEAKIEDNMELEEIEMLRG